MTVAEIYPAIAVFLIADVFLIAEAARKSLAERRDRSVRYCRRARRRYLRRYPSSRAEAASSRRVPRPREAYPQASGPAPNPVDAAPPRASRVHWAPSR